MQTGTYVNLTSRKSDARQPTHPATPHLPPGTVATATARLEWRPLSVVTARLRVATATAALDHARPGQSGRRR